jgi:hypothetical protein
MTDPINQIRFSSLTLHSMPNDPQCAQDINFGNAEHGYKIPREPLYHVLGSKRLSDGLLKAEGQPTKKKKRKKKIEDPGLNFFFGRHFLSMPPLYAINPNITRIFFSIAQMNRISQHLLLEFS